MQQSQMCYISCFFLLDPSYKMFGLLAGSIVMVGAIVGGVVGILLPHLSTGLNVGVLVALLISSVRISFNIQ